MLGLNVEDVIAGLDPAERRKVEELAADFISEEMTPGELRRARHLKGDLATFAAALPVSRSEAMDRPLQHQP